MSSRLGEKHSKILLRLDGCYLSLEVGHAGVLGPAKTSHSPGLAIKQAYTAVRMELSMNSTKLIFLLGELMSFPMNIYMLKKGALKSGDSGGFRTTINTWMYLPRASCRSTAKIF